MSKSKNKYYVGTGKTREEKFWSKVNKTKTCWLWMGSCDKDGYGQTSLNYERMHTHIMAWILTYGKRPTKWLLHSCDTPNCVNPAHLREGTAKDNAQDRVKRNRNADFKGEKHPHAKLSNSDILSIRERVAKGETQISLAKEYGVHYVTIHDIVRRQNWKHI